MRTESLRRVYCDAYPCINAFNVWMPYDVDDIPQALRDAGAYVEVHELHTHANPTIALGRVLCPECNKKAK